MDEFLCLPIDAVRLSSHTIIISLRLCAAIPLTFGCLVNKQDFNVKIRLMAEAIGSVIITFVKYTWRPH